MHCASGQRIGQVRIDNPPVLSKERSAENAGGGYQDPVRRISVKRIWQRRDLCRNRRGNSLPPHQRRRYRIVQPFAQGCR